MGFLFRKAAGPQTNRAGESFPISDLCSPESDVGLSCPDERRRAATLGKMQVVSRTSLALPVRDSCHLGLAGLADAATRVFDFRNLSQEPLHKKPA